MGKAEFGTAKHAANQMKAHGPQKLKFYCQICEKQCRDDNGFKCHIQSKSHLNKLNDRLSNAQDGGKSLIEDYSQKFLTDFLRLLRMSHGEKPIGAKRFYQEYILNKDHIHMNSTKWNNLTNFVMYLKEHDYCTVEISEDEDDGAERFTLTYIDKSPEAVARKLASKKEIALKTDEEQSLRILQRQIEKGGSVIQSKEPVDDESMDLESGRIDNGQDRDAIKISMKPIMKCGMKIIPTDLQNGVEGKQTDETTKMFSDNGIKFKNGLKLKSRLNKTSTAAPKVGNVFKMKKAV